MSRMTGYRSQALPTVILLSDGRQTTCEWMSIAAAARTIGNNANCQLADLSSALPRPLHPFSFALTLTHFPSHPSSRSTPHIPSLPLPSLCRPFTFPLPSLCYRRRFERRHRNRDAYEGCGLQDRCMYREAQTLGWPHTLYSVLLDPSLDAVATRTGRRSLLSAALCSRPVLSPSALASRIADESNVGAAVCKGGHSRRLGYECAPPNRLRALRRLRAPDEQLDYRGQG